MPFERLVEQLQPSRDPSRSPLFQIAFVLENASQRRLELAELSATACELDIGTAQFDLTLLLEQGESGLSGLVEYSTDLFDATTVRRLVGHFEALLAGMLAEEARLVGELPLLRAAERQQLLVEWNDTAIEVRSQESGARSETSDPWPLTPDSWCVHEFFEQQATRTPDAVALVFDRGQGSGVRDQESPAFSLQPSAFSLQLTYAELDARANRLAWHLRALGVGPEMLVGICIERSLELVIGLLGILKAGAAYVPLDPSYPAERITFMFEDSRAAVLITRGRGSGVRGQDGNVPAPDPWPLTSDPWSVVDLCADWPAIARMCAAPPSSPVAGENLAYVLYTSGSTGTPKGVMVTHRGLLNYLHWSTRAYALADGRGAPLHSAIGFDLTVTSLFAPLLSGQRVELLPEALAGQALASALAQADEFSLVKLTPAHLDGLLPLLAPERAARATRALVIGGEALRSEQLAFWRSHAPATRLFNEYGPTETVVGCCVYELPPGPLPPGSVPIGRPIANTQIYLLDRQMEVVPLGVVGELYVGGVQLARGYLGRPDLTAERFVPNPFADLTPSAPLLPGEGAGGEVPRLYRTGDLARWLPDGTIDYLGRLDHQVKLRGYRIELDEIETVVRQHHAVHECAVLVRKDLPGDKRLVAYLVTSDELQVTSSSDPSLVTRHSSLIAELRAFLKQRLPDYMIPSAFVVLDALPLTPNGKLDRVALPPPHQDRESLIDERPRTPTEELVAGIWMAVLGHDQVGRNDNFFALGGHSLLATRVLARVREVFQIELPLRALFAASTVAGLAEEIMQVQQVANPVWQLELQPQPRGAVVPLSFVQQRLWFLQQLNPTSPAYHLPYVLHLTGALDLAALARTLTAVVARHEALRTTFGLHDDQPTQQIAAPARVALPLLDLAALPTERREPAAHALARATARVPFDLTGGPLLRLAVLRLAPDAHQLLLTMHHIISDGWSIGVLASELGQLYTAFRTGRAPDMTPLPIQYADYALWQRAWLQGAVLDVQLAYWRQQFASAPSTLDLPTDRPRPPVMSFAGANMRLTLDAALTPALHALSRQAGTTLFMTLLAAFQALLSRYSGQNDILVGSPIAGRRHPAIEPLIGFFVNTLVLRSTITPHQTVRQLLQQVRELCLQAYAHQDVPFERLVEQLQPSRDPSRSPLFQIAFVLENASQRRLELAELSATACELDIGTAQFDLTLLLEQGESGLSGLVEYSTDLFDATTVRRLVGHFEALLAGMLAEEAQLVGELPLLRAAERQQLLVEWNASAAEYPCERGVQALFAAQAARTPDAVALVFDPGATKNERRTTNGSVSSSIVHRPSSPIQHLTYRELNCRANQLAWHLRALGIGPEMLVGICIERSLELVIGLLGILKAGAAYVPLDPSYPAERITFMFEDSRAAVLITRGRGSGVRGQDGNVPAPDPWPLTSDPWSVVDLCADWPAIAQARADEPPSHATTANLAYVIYTSGSTGTPKGVQIPHRGLLNLIGWHVRTFGLTPADRATLIAGVAFDASVWELWPYLVVGASLHIPDEPLRSAPEALRDWLLAQAITICFLPTPLAEQLLPLAWPRQTRLRRLLTGGDWLHESPSPQLPFALINNYGPTEHSVVATSAAMMPLGGGGPPPIGRPIANTSIYILDQQLQPTPIGIPGELYTSGDGLARGYLNRPDLTAERFVPNPFGDCRLQIADCRGAQSTICNLQSAIGTRLYKTGDRARWLPDGMIEYLGRLDHQVKIRGFRIELGEIESVLQEHPAVRAAVVVARDDAPPASGQPDPRLVAYVVPTEGTGNIRTTNDVRCPEGAQTNAGSDPSSFVVGPSSLIGELRDFLKSRLPNYMLPAAFMLLDALPKTPNGKIDRRALPAPAEIGAARSRPFAPPRTSAEELLASIWAEILRIKEIGIHDSFFDLGGHSLLATQVVSRVNRSFRTNLPIRCLFEAPSIAELASYMVANESQPGQIEKTAQLIQRIKRMSADDVRAKLQQNKHGDV